jgi:hypothetical protein
MEILEKMQEALDTAKEDARKFENGNKAAGTRLRVKMQSIKADAQKLRVEVQERRANN